MMTFTSDDTSALSFIAPARVCIADAGKSKKQSLI